MEKSQHIFFCETCQYRTDNKQHYKNHEASKKHKDINENEIKLYVCECKKPYKSYMGFWRHKSTCSVFNEKKIPKNEVVKSENLSQDNSFLLLKMEEMFKKQKNIENSSIQDNSLLLLKIEKLENLIVELSKNQKP